MRAARMPPRIADLLAMHLPAEHGATAVSTTVTGTQGPPIPATKPETEAPGDETDRTNTRVHAHLRAEMLPTDMPTTRLL